MLKFLIYVCLFGLAAAFSDTTDPPPTPPTTTTTIKPSTGDEEFKSGAIIYNGKTAACLGAFVASNKVVTAAHCVRGASNLSVKYKQESLTINYVIIHPFYKPALFDYDIAVLKIEGTPTSEVMSLSDKENDISEVVYVSKIKTEQELVGKTAKKEGRQTCQSKHGSKIRISTKMICAQLQENVLGGSALYYKKPSKNANTYYLAGVASYSSPNSSLPTIFTNIANSEIYKFIDRYL